MLTLVEKRKSIASIIVSEEAIPVELHSANELNKYIFQMTGEKLPIGTLPNDNANIFIGSAASSREIDLSEDVLGFDGYLIKNVDRTPNKKRVD